MPQADEMHKVLRTTLLGAGKSGRAFAATLSRDPRFQWVGISAGKGTSAMKMGQEYGVTTNVPKSDVHLTIVASPHDVHVDQVIEALASGSHVLVEKPVALDHAGLTDICDAAAKAGRRVFCAFVQRCSPTMPACRDYVQARAADITSIAIEQTLYRDISYYATWKGDPVRAGGGNLINQAIHAIDLAFHLTGASPRSASCSIWNRPGIDVEDGVVGFIETDTVPISVVARTSAAVEEKQVIRIFLSDCTVIVVGSESPSWSIVRSDVTRSIADLADNRDEFGSTHGLLLSDVADAIIKNADSAFSCELEDIVPAHQTVWAMYHSHQNDGLRTVI